MAQPTRPVLGYLTTSWTPPASCFSVQVPGAETASKWHLAFQGRTCITARSWPSDAPDCWPPRTANAPPPPTNDFFRGWGFYSPGTLCPSGFTTACVATYGKDVTNWDSLQFPLTVGETAAGCCPSGGYTCYAFYPFNEDSVTTYDLAQTCRLLATSTTIEAIPCVATTDGIIPQLFSEVVPYTSSITTDSATLTTTYSTFAIQAPLIQINWRAEDLATAIPTSTSSTSAERNISGGAIAGIAIGAVLGLAGIEIGIFWYVRKKRTRGTKVTSQLHEPDYTPPSQQQSPSVKSQQHTTQPIELLTTESIQELPAHGVADEGLRVELQG